MLLTENSPFDLVPDQVYAGKRLYFYDKREDIPMREEGIWQVYRGIVQLSTFQVSGEEILLGWATSSSLFGGDLTNLAICDGKALTEVYLRWFSRQEIENSPSLTQVMWTQLSQRLKQTESLLAIAGVKRVEDRLRQLLDLLKQELGEPVASGIKIPIRLTHQNLANAIGTTRVTVTRLLGELQRQEYLALDRDRHIILKE